MYVPTYDYNIPFDVSHCGLLMGTLKGSAIKQGPVKGICAEALTAVPNWVMLSMVETMNLFLIMTLS